LIERLPPDEARQWFLLLPPDRRLATLSPDYVITDAGRSAGIEAVFLGYREGPSMWLHGVHRSAVPGLDCVDQQSPYGYGGPWTNSDDPGFIGRAWNEYVEHCRRDGVLAEFVRVHPLAMSWRAYGGEIRENRATVAIDLTQVDVRMGYETRCRTAVRKAEKSGVAVSVVSNEHISTSFARMYRDAMTAIGADKFYLFEDGYFRSMSALPGIQLVGGFVSGECVAAALFLISGTTMEYHLSAATDTGRRLAATSALVDGAAQQGKAAGLRYLYLGGGTDSNPNNPLLFFKRGFSQTTLPFCIGHTIFRAGLYQSLRDEHRARGGDVSRVLFYRN